MQPEFRLSTGDHQPGFKFPALEKEPLPLTEKHRPRFLAEMVGHHAIMPRLKAYLRKPTSGAMLFHGIPGCGKSSMAQAIANELGALDMAGLDIVKSGTADKEEISKILRDVHYTPFPRPGSSGWHVVIVDEADQMTPAAKQLWLSALEALPPRCLIIFTTNDIPVLKKFVVETPDGPEEKEELVFAKFERRFIRRCQVYGFEASYAPSIPDAQALIDRIWQAETGGNHSPRIGSLRDVTIDGSISFGCVVQALVPLIDARNNGEDIPDEPTEQPAPTPPSPVKSTTTHSMSVEDMVTSDVWAQSIHRTRPIEDQDIPQAAPVDPQPESDDSLPPIAPIAPWAAKPAPAQPQVNQAVRPATRATGSIDWKSVVRRFQSGESVQELAADLGITVARVELRLTNRGCLA